MHLNLRGRLMVGQRTLNPFILVRIQVWQLVYTKSMKFVIINGPSCAGKSTVTNQIILERDRFYKLSYDAQKWLFSKYKADFQFEDVTNVIQALAEAHGRNRRPDHGEA